MKKLLLLILFALALLFLLRDAEGANHIVTGTESLGSDTTWDTVWINGILYTDNFNLDTGSCWVNGSFYGNDTSTVNHTYLQINGTYSACSGETQMAGNFDNAGVFVHNDAIVEFSGASSDIYIQHLSSASTSFHNLYFNDVAQQTRIEKDITVINEMHLKQNIKVILYTKSYTFGNSTQGGTINLDYDLTLAGGVVQPKIYAASQQYPVDITGHGPLWDRYSEAIWYLKWVNIDSDTTTDSGDVDHANIILDGDCTFQAFTLSSGDTLNLSGHKATFNGTFTTTGTLITGGTSEVDLTSNASWTINQAVTLHSFDCDGTTSIQKNLTYTNISGFETSTGTVDVLGSFGDLVYITGPQYWEINTTLLTDYQWLYVNCTNGSNNGSRVMVILGEYYSCIGTWDNIAPLITPNTITEGIYWDKNANPLLVINWTANSYPGHIHSMNITVYCKDNSTLMFTRQINGTTFGEVCSYTWVYLHNITDWSLGNYNVSYVAWDTHNPPKTKKGLARAKNMMCVLETGDIIGHKVGKKEIKETDSKTLDFFNIDKLLESLFSVEFSAQSKQKVKWTGTNYKITHIIKVPLPQKPAILGIPLKIYAEEITYLHKSPFAGHFVINNLYFYDFQDFEEAGGKVLVESKGYDKERQQQYYSLILTHPQMKANQWFTVDPLSGAVNEASNLTNFTIGAIPLLISPTNGSTVTQTTQATLTVNVTCIDALNGTISFFNGTGAYFGGQNNVTNNTEVTCTYLGLSPDTNYTWYVTLNITLIGNGTSATWGFSTPSEDANGGSGGGGDGGGGSSTLRAKNEYNDVLYAGLVILFIVIVVGIATYTDFFGGVLRRK